MELRGHHLLCLLLFEGKGYDAAFTENMRRTRERFIEQGALICDGADDICKCCPNLTEDGCALGDPSDMDESTKAALGTQTGAFIKGRDAAAAAYLLDGESFLGICGGCRWYRAGVCSAVKLHERIEGLELV